MEDEGRAKPLFAKNRFRHPETQGLQTVLEPLHLELIKGGSECKLARTVLHNHHRVWIILQSLENDPKSPPNADPLTYSLVLPHLSCEIFRATFSQCWSVFPASSWRISQFSPDFSQAQPSLVSFSQA